MTSAVTVIEESRPIIVGSGIAGLSAALSLEGSLVVTSGSVGRGSSWLAQGGMAAAIGAPDSARHHAADTVRVGGGIADGDIARRVADAAPAIVEWLTGLGTRFDRSASDDIALGREAGHSHRRIVHAGGDATGAEIMRALRAATVLREDIALLTETQLIDLIRSGDRVVGVLTRSGGGAVTAHLGPAVVLATGGIGGLYARSTNPADVTGAGLAAAARQGATLADLEFVQFHPTALAAIDHPAPLISEALRGEGATLIDETGRRFMTGIHPDGELAPRDVVARAIWRHRRDGHRVYLDASATIGDAMPERFPTAFRHGCEVGVDARVAPLEVAPAEHFHMGGIATDIDGRSSVPGLWAVGEVASTGLHGANRLASNSLLEGAVLATRAAAAVRADTDHATTGPLLIPWDARERITTDATRHTAAIRALAWDALGIERSERGLQAAVASLDALDGPTTDAALVAGLIARSALERRESRGAHHRSDHPTTDERSARRSLITVEPTRLVGLADAPVLAS